MNERDNLVVETVDGTRFPLCRTKDIELLPEGFDEQFKDLRACLDVNIIHSGNRAAIRYVTLKNTLYAKYTVEGSFDVIYEDSEPVEHYEEYRLVDYDYKVVAISIVCTSASAEFDPALKKKILRHKESHKDLSDEVFIKIDTKDGTWFPICRVEDKEAVEVDYVSIFGEDNINEVDGVVYIDLNGIEYGGNRFEILEYADEHLHFYRHYELLGPNRISFGFSDINMVIGRKNDSQLNKNVFYLENTDVTSVEEFLGNCSNDEILLSPSASSSSGSEFGAGDTQPFHDSDELENGVGGRDDSLPTTPGAATPSPPPIGPPGELDEVKLMGDKRARPRARRV